MPWSQGWVVSGDGRTRHDLGVGSVRISFNGRETAGNKRPKLKLHYVHPSEICSESQPAFCLVLSTIHVLDLSL